MPMSPIGSPIDQYASYETTSVYTGVRTFSMLPEELSTDLTSLNESVDRAAVVIDFVVGPDGSIGSGAIYRALVRNQAQLTYNGVGPWLEGTAPPPPKVAASAALQQQLKLQDEAAQLCSAERQKHGRAESGSRGAGGRGFRRPGARESTREDKIAPAS